MDYLIEKNTCFQLTYDFNLKNESLCSLKDVSLTWMVYFSPLGWRFGLEIYKDRDKIDIIIDNNFI